MCVNYRPSRPEFIRDHFNLDIVFEYKIETWKGYSAPIIINHDGVQKVESASFGLIPPWCKSSLDAKKLTSGTMNCRSETVGQKPSFKNAWHKSHLCLVPMSEFYEPCYESGKAVRYRVGMSTGEDFCVGGIWGWWVDPETKEGKCTFSMLTMNADAHPVLNRLHKPGDEKRSLYVVPRQDYDNWLNAEPEIARTMLTLMRPEDYVIGEAAKKV